MSKAGHLDGKPVVLLAHTSLLVRKPVILGREGGDLLLGEPGADLSLVPLLLAELHPVAPQTGRGILSRVTHADLCTQLRAPPPRPPRAARRLGLGCFSRPWRSQSQPLCLLLPLADLLLELGDHLLQGTPFPFGLLLFHLRDGAQRIVLCLQTSVADAKLCRVRRLVRCCVLSHGLVATLLRAIDRLGRVNPKQLGSIDGVAASIGSCC